MIRKISETTASQLETSSIIHGNIQNPLRNFVTPYPHIIHTKFHNKIRLK